jgi:PTH1 family peptidyl-tRNA hydrolase
MWLVVGLGNPGKIYTNTRHNIGFMVIDSLSDKFSIPLQYKAKNFTYGRGFIEEKEALLLKPLTFMNKSGVALRDTLREYKDIENILVIHDDLDLDKGIIRIKRNGSSGGHKGIESIIENIGTKDFLRLKIGIGRSKRVPPEDYVLSPFPRREQTMVRKTVERAVNAIVIILNKGVSYAQNEFHRK